MLKRITGKLGASKHKEKCTITVNIKRLESLPEALKQVMVVWEKDGLVKAQSSSCAVHKGKWSLSKRLHTSCSQGHLSLPSWASEPWMIDLSLSVAIRSPVPFDEALMSTMYVVWQPTEVQGTLHPAVTCAGSADIHEQLRHDVTLKAAHGAQGDFAAKV